jgi:hypothetical protein
MTSRFLFLIVLLIHVIDTRAQELNQDAEVLYVTFNQPQYAAGDTAFFKLTFPTNQRKLSKSLINMALFKDGNHVLLQRTMIKDGIYAGYLNLPTTIIKGSYVLAIEINGMFYEGIFNVCSNEDHKNFKTDSTFIFTDFGIQPYDTRESVTVNLEVKEIQEEAVAVSIIREDLFVSENIVVCNLTDRKINQVGAFPDYFSGKVISTLGKKVPDSLKITFFLQNNDFVYPVYTGLGGQFKFPLFKNFGSDNVFYTISHRGASINSFSIVLDEIFQRSALTSSPQVSNDPVLYEDFIKRKRLIQKSYEFFLDQDQRTQPYNNLDSYQGDMEVNLEKFEKFQTMSEIVINILPAVKYRKNQKRESVRVFLQESAQIAANDPLYIIDGVVTDSTEVFLSLDTEKIKTIKILRSPEKLRRFGDLGKNGMLVVESKVLGGLQIAPSSKSLPITGINEGMTFNNDYKEENHLAPDVRSCLYWNPNVKLDTQGKATLTFNTGEITGPIRMAITGTSKQGDFRYFERMVFCKFRRRE